MSKTSTFKPPFKRRGEGKTNYVKRLAYMKSGLPRAVIRRSTNHMSIQFIKTEKGKDFVLAHAHTKELGEFNYHGHSGNIPAAYLAGYLAGLRFKKEKAASTIVDLGVQRTILGTRLFAVIKGIQDAGIAVQADPASFPKEDRLVGKHVEAYAQADHSKTNRVQFSSYKGKKVDPTAFSKMVEETKKTMSSSVKA